MRDLRYTALLAFLLFMISSGYCKERIDSRNLSEKSLLNFIMKIIRDLKKYNLEETKIMQYVSKQTDYSMEEKEDRDYKLYQDEQRIEIFPRDLRMKDKFLKHLTGPLYYSAKCSRYFHRLYHSTKDCTIPAYYKRCARLLTRLAVSPVCMDG
ncbi:ALK and LTK ligand 2 [Bombina bombina]|uniref:ALK and LTK ligand 2 n=1 Tax=Bombina bombina TaxID=8345 RepID=UPI00235AA7CF|nr:ALK and LTK ligand 2 [Bombina bombina]